MYYNFRFICFSIEITSSITRGRKKLWHRSPIPRHWLFVSATFASHAVDYAYSLLDHLTLRLA